jgi:hypothetical protein
VIGGRGVRLRYLARPFPYSSSKRAPAVALVIGAATAPGNTPFTASETRDDAWMETSKDDERDRNQRVIRRAKEVRERAAEQLRRARAKRKSRAKSAGARQGTTDAGSEPPENKSGRS